MDEPEMVRRSARQRAKGNESIMDRAMNLKKARSLESNLSGSSLIAHQGIPPASQANSANTANSLQPATAATGHHMNHTRATKDQAVLASSNRVAERGPANLKSIAHDSVNTSTFSGKNDGLAIQPLTRAPVVDAQGKQSASKSTTTSQTGDAAYKLPCGKNNTPSNAERNDNLEAQYHFENSGTKDYYLEKPISSLKQGPSSTDHISCESINAAMQAGPAVSAAAVKPRSSTATRRISRSSIAGSKNSQITLAGTTGVAIAGGSDTQNLQRISIPLSSTVSAKTVFQDVKKCSTHSANDTGTLVSPLPTMPTRCAANVSVRGVDLTNNFVAYVPAQGVALSTKYTPIVPSQGRSSACNARCQSDAEIHRSLPKRTRDNCVAKSNYVPENKDHHKNAVPKNKDLNEKVITKTANGDKKATPSSSQQKKMYYIKVSGSQQGPASPPPLMPLGERCQLCKIDLAFLAKGSDARADDPPFSAILPCSHTYHDSCLRDVFGDVEPPCIRCLEVGEPQGS